MKQLCVLLLLAVSFCSRGQTATASVHGQAKESFRNQEGRRVIYQLYVADTVVVVKEHKVTAIAINGSIPAPQLDFTEGDTAEIHVHNLMHMETSIHWHGLILPNNQDGVPYLTTAPIKGHTTAVYSFPIVQNGTYWYHAHSKLQEQSGLYGALIIQKRDAATEKQFTALLSDFSVEKPERIERSLHNASDWYGVKKGATQDYSQALKEGQLGVKLQNEWKRMMAMDVSDVYYDVVTVNGKSQDHFKGLLPKEKLRLRVINGSSSSYFWLRFAGGKLRVLATDGSEVVPVEVDRLIVGVSETYDLEVTLPGDGSFEFSATSEDRAKSTSLWIGNGERHALRPLHQLQYFEGMEMMNDMMKMNGAMNGMSMGLQQMDMNTLMYPEMVDGAEPVTTLNYSMLRAKEQTTLPPGPLREIKLELTGNMNRYVWSINNKTLSESNKIIIRKGENIRVVISNNSMMRHPMHLHGNFFRVLNGQGDYSPLKTVLDIMPMETDTIEFHASENAGDWYFHCHILYHMMAGMGRIFGFVNAKNDSAALNFVQDIGKVYRDDRRFYLSAQISLESNGSDGRVGLSNTRWLMQTEWRLGLNGLGGYESETHIGRFAGLNQWLMPYIGFDWRSGKYDAADKQEAYKEWNLFGQYNSKNARVAVSVGVQYLLPMLIKADARIDMSGNLRLQLGREDLAVSKRLRFNFYLNSDKEYMAGFRYIVSKYLSLSTHYDSDMHWGGGVTLNY